MVSLSVQMNLSDTNDFNEESKTSCQKYPVSDNPRTLQDPVHGAIELDKVYWTMIDTPQFKRLQNLK